MYEKQMELFNDGGLYDEGGMVDEVSGNDVPPGSTRKEVRDDIPAMLSEGEFVFPADVVRYFGLEKLMEMRQEAKMGMKKMEAMGQMGNADEAVIPDDLPFSPEDLIIMMPGQESMEMARGGVVKAQAGTFVQPSGFQGSTLGTPPTVPPSSVAPTNPQGTPTGYLPSFVGQSANVSGNTYQNTSGTIGMTGSTAATDSGTDFVPTVEDVYNFRTYRNPTTGEIREFAFYQGQPVIPIPDGFEPYTPETDTTATEDVTVQETLGAETTYDSGDGDRDDVFDLPTPEGPDISSMNAEELAEAANSVRTMNTMAAAAGLAVNPVFGLVMAAAARLQKNAINRRAAELGIENPFSSPTGFLPDIVNNIVDNIRDIFTVTEEEAQRGGGTGGTSLAPEVSPTPTRSPLSQTPTPSSTYDEGPATSYTTRTPSSSYDEVGVTQTTRPATTPASTYDEVGVTQTTRPDTSSDNSTSGGGSGATRSGAAGDGTRGGSSGSTESTGGAAGSGAARGGAAGDGTRGGGMTGGADLDTAYSISGLNKGGLATKKQQPKKKTPNKNSGVAARKKK